MYVNTLNKLYNSIGFYIGNFLDKNFRIRFFIVAINFSLKALCNFIDLFIRKYVHKGLLNNYVTLYAKFHWLVSHIQLSFQPSTYSADRRDTAVLVLTDGSPRRQGSADFTA